MKKKIIFIIIIILIILGSIFVINKINSQKYKYEISTVEQYNYFKYKENDKFGVIDRNGQIIIQAKYTDVIIPNPEIDVFICSDGGEKNIILNSSNEELFTQYDNVEPIKLKNIISILCYEKNALAYEKDGLYGLINFEGKELTQNIYTSIENLLSTEGKFLVKKDDKYGVINQNGQVIIDTEYDRIQTDKYYSQEDKYVKSGFIVATKNEDGYRYGYINYEGKKILDTEYNNITRIEDEEEIYLIASKDGKYGLYQGSKQLIEHDYQSIIYNDNGSLTIQKNKNYGAINLKGEIIVDLKYTSITSQGLYLYAKNSNENTVYDADGNKVDINFNKVVYTTDNEEYRITTLTNNNVVYYGITNKDGTELVKTKYKYIEYAYGNYFIAKDDSENLGVIDANGNIVIEFKYDMVQKIKEKNAIQTLDTDTYETEIYSSELNLVATLANATVSNNTNYIKLYNENETIYFDSNGNKISEDSDIVKEETSKAIPDSIGGFLKVQESLDDIYFEKE